MARPASVPTLLVRFEELDELTPEGAADLIEDIEQHGGSAQVSGGHTPLGAAEVTLVSELSIAALQVGAVGWMLAALRDRFRRAVIVDLTKDPPEVRPARHLPSSTVIVKSEEGVSTIEAKGDLSSAVDAILRAATRGS